MPARIRALAWAYWGMAMNEPRIRELTLAAYLGDLGQLIRLAEGNKARLQSVSDNAASSETAAASDALTAKRFILSHCQAIKGVETEQVASLASAFREPVSSYDYILAIAESLAADYSPISPETYSIQTEREKNKPRSYQEALRDFNADLKALIELEAPENQFDIAFDCVMERLLWRFPAGKRSSLPLYIHSRLRAAFAGALYKYHEATDSLFSESQVKDENSAKLMFVTGRLSASDDFLYASTGQDLTATLVRAKALELRMLREAWSISILEALGLPLPCRIISAGDFFLIIGPAVESAKRTLDALRQEIDQSFLRDYHGELALYLSWDTVRSLGDLTHRSPALILEDCAFSIKRAELNCFQSILRRPGGEAEHIFDKGYDELVRYGACPLCGKNAADTEYQGEKLCRFCKTRQSWGAALIKSPWIQMGKQEKGDNLAAGDRIYFAKKDENYGFREKTAFWSLSGSTPGLGKLSFPSYLPRSESADHKGKSNTENPKKNAFIGFEDLARHSIGESKIAFLRIELDEQNAPPDNLPLCGASLAQSAAFSKALDHFFTDWLDQRLASNQASIYIIHSYGQGLHAVGAWNEIIDFAFDIHNELGRWLGEDSVFGLSAGVICAPPAASIGVLAKYSASALAEARLYRDKLDNTRKSAIKLFGHSVSWEDAALLINQGKKLAAYAKTRNSKALIPMRLIRNLLTYADQEDAFRTRLDRPVLWRSALASAAAANIADEELRRWFMELALATIANGSVRILATYALYRARKAYWSAGYGAVNHTRS